MATAPVLHIVQAGEGELLKLGPPASGDIVIKVDPRRSGSAYAMGTETLQPGAAIPVHRHVYQDEVLFIHKGQGRATCEGKAVTVVPGSLVYAPRGIWHGLRNTGTGPLQVTWTVAPPGIEEFFRELSRLKEPVEPATLQAMGQRHGIEFQPPGAPSPGRAPSRSGERHRLRHRGRHHRPSARVAAAPSRQSQTPVQAKPSPAPTAQAAPTPPTAAARHLSPGRRGRHRGRVKEVYMGGRWVQVTGEGPVIAPGQEHREQGQERR